MSTPEPRVVAVWLDFSGRYLATRFSDGLCVWNDLSGLAPLLRAGAPAEDPEGDLTFAERRRRCLEAQLPGV